MLRRHSDSTRRMPASTFRWPPRSGLPRAPSRQRPLAGRHWCGNWCGARAPSIARGVMFLPSPHASVTFANGFWSADRQRGPPSDDSPALQRGESCGMHVCSAVKPPGSHGRRTL